MVLELIKIYKNRWILLVWLTLLIYLLIFFSHGFDDLDHSIYQCFAFLHYDMMTHIVRFITFFGSTTAIVLICFLCILIKRRLGIFISLNVATVAMINQIIKHTVARQRPSVLRLAIEQGYSFPSAHAMVSFALFGLLAYLLWNNNKTASCLLMLLTFFIGLSRIYLGVHYTTDVIAGYLFAFTYLCTMIPLFKYHKILPIS